MDNKGRVLARAQAGPSNVVVVGKRQATMALQKVLSAVGVPLDAVVAGMAGADRPWVREFWHHLLYPNVATDVWVVGDYRIAWAALTDGNPGMAAVFGTGSVIYAENGDHRIKVGGYGFKVGDVGSGIQLGQRAIQQVLADLDGWGSKTRLTDSVLAWARVANKDDLINYLYDPAVDWRTVSDLASEVFSLADQDEGARAILEQQASHITLQMRSAYTRAALEKETASIGMTGGLSPFWLPYLQRACGYAEYPALQLIERSPVEGAARLALAWSGDLSDNDSEV